MGTGNILVIDSELASLAMISNTLRLEGHAVNSSDDPIMALVHAEKKDGLKPDLVLTDLNLRPIGGFEIARRLRLADPNLPIVYMADSQGIADVIVGTLGPNAVLRKPFTAKQLRSIVKRRLANKRTSS